LRKGFVKIESLKKPAKEGTAPSRGVERSRDVPGRMDSTSVSLNDPALKTFSPREKKVNETTPDSIRKGE